MARLNRFLPLRAQRSHLTRIEREILRLRFGTPEPTSYWQLGRRLHMSPLDVVRLEHKALRHLRHHKLPSPPMWDEA
ncbi:MAG: hypothetical protein KatS3mg077_2623 [Candidatus Binatia bacterium]|nr:MAG: hypothetical protein KatS3mg077_2623 [Candidatus Binatia bacterium]